MKRLILASMITLLMQTPSPAGTYESWSGGRNEHYGISYPTVPGYVAGGVSTGTIHHRTARSTFIGASTLQTEANTAETMGKVQYRPTAVSPALGPSYTRPSIGRIKLFSSQMGAFAATPFPSPSGGALSVIQQGAEPSPAFAPIITRFRTPGEFGAPALGATSLYSGELLSLPGRQGRRGGGFGGQLINPLEGF